MFIAIAGLLATTSTSVAEPQSNHHEGIELQWDELDTGVASNVVDAGLYDGAYDQVPADTVRLRKCHWAWYDRHVFEFVFEPTFPVAFPVTLEVDAVLLLDPAGLADDVGMGKRFAVTIDGPGVFRLPLNQAVPHRTSIAESFVRPLGVCQGLLGGSLLLEGARKPTRAVRPPISRFGPNSLETLVSSIQIGKRSEKLRAIGALLSNPDLPAIDRLYVAPDFRVGHISLGGDVVCDRILTAFTKPDVTLVQERGCPQPNLSGYHKLVTRDRHWRVTVVGKNKRQVERVHSNLKRFRAKSVPKLDPSGKKFDAGRWLDGQIDNDPDIEEVARFPWKNGLVSIVQRGNGFERYADPIVGLPVIPNPTGGEGTRCTEYGIGTYRVMRGGFLFVVAENPPIRAVVTTDVEAIELDFVSTDDGRAVAFLDTKGLGRIQKSMVQILNPKGTPVECDQNFDR